ncbi:MAG: ribonuclease HI family protein [Candidatus Adlerbacteria bacterium]|nr:ribonuclease HI family protein [Candidatus Adlerbacteria bacterium]MDZ4226040.1 ribonuclease HI family protein [Patescibacteria group bacterium]
MPDLVVYTDGGARGNPGPAAIGVVVEDRTGKIIKELSAYIGETTNNQAEYEALSRGLGELKKMFGEELRELKVEVRMDSELVVRQLSGQYRVKEPGLKEQFAKVAKMRMEDVPNLTFVHVPREENTRADALVNDALDARG